jgi:acetyl-CoA carboxylase carboxyl transferase subunit beta
MAVEDRLRSLFDAGSHRRVEVPRPPVDPLRFKDLRKYTERLKEAQNTTSRAEAIAVGVGLLGDIEVVVACLDFSFLGGSMGLAVGEGLLVAATTAVAQRAPLLIVAASGGARMQEGILSLMQMARTTIAVRTVREQSLPVIVVLADPTTGGVSASFAMLGDITIAEPGAMIGFAGARVIEQTIRERLPDGFQRAEYLLEHGMIDMVVPRKDLKARIATLIGLLCRPVPQVDEGLDAQS